MLIRASGLMVGFEGPTLDDVLLARELRRSNQLETIVGGRGVRRGNRRRETTGERDGARENTSTNNVGAGPAITAGAIGAAAPIRSVYGFGRSRNAAVPARHTQNGQYER
jgi:hypothetical protein